MNAQFFLNQYWSNGSIPIDPFLIARRAGIRLECLPQDVPDSFSGDYTPSHQGAPALIRYNSTHSLVRQRFTLAHELGHHALGHGLSYRDDSRAAFSTQNYDPAEVGANRFAAELLMPHTAIEYAMTKLLPLTIENLAQTFQVSEVAMRFRLEKLGVINRA
ncbi:MAG: ImmA/IrrE family metallo-endopeptidase [Cytophagales bacterium]|nr:ImmA/IrrE family metallo-endopeptidase [Cytophagales bacterium]